MNIPETTVTKNMSIVRVFRPASNEDNEKLYVEFENEASVNIVHRYKKNLAQGLRIFPWFSPALYARFKALSDEAYQIRKVRQPFHQTDIRYESTDIALYKRIDRTYRWQKCEVEGLPDICIDPDLLTRPSDTPPRVELASIREEKEILPVLLQIFQTKLQECLLGPNKLKFLIYRVNLFQHQAQSQGKL